MAIPKALGRQPTAVVIGSGFGGLAAAIRLQRRGYQTQILEKLDQPGGRARVFRRDGFVFDAGPTVITAPFLLEDLFALCGEKMADTIVLLPVDPFYHIRFFDGTTFCYNGDAVAMRRQVAQLSPKDVEGYERFLKKSKEIFDVGFGQLAHVPFTTWTSMAKIIPKMLMLQSFRSVYDMASQYVQDLRLRQVLSFHPLLVGGNPFTTTSIYTLILYLERKFGVFFPKGGTHVLVTGLLQLFYRQGGKFRANAPVTRILTRQQTAIGVELDNGEQIAADIVVANSDVAWTYKYLIPAAVRHVWTDQKLHRKSYSMGLFVWYFGTKRQYEDVAHHSILLGPRYQGLLTDIFQHRILAEDFSLYLHRPTATDANLAPPGCDTFYVLSPVPNLQSGHNWQIEGPIYQQRLCAFLSATVLPNLQHELCHSFWMTPQTFYDELWSEAGAAFGMEPTLRQSAYLRPHNQSEDIQNLFFVGAGTHPGAGLPGVLSSARVLEELLPQ